MMMNDDYNGDHGNCYFQRTPFRNLHSPSLPTREALWADVGETADAAPAWTSWSPSKMPSALGYQHGLELHDNFGEIIYYYIHIYINMYKYYNIIQ